MKYRHIFIILFFCFILSEILYRFLFIGSFRPILYSKPNENAHILIDKQAKLIAQQRKISEDLYYNNPVSRIYDTTNAVLTQNLLHSFEGLMIDDLAKEWNRNFYDELFVKNIKDYRKVVFKGYDGWCYSFSGYDSTSHPFYRYIPNTTIQGSKLKFNDFGFTGNNIKFIKPENTIRIAFVGGSTTQQMPYNDFSYPDYIEIWLDKWAENNSLNIDFEVINTGRVAQQSMDFFATIKYELLPLFPDIVIYYEGRNQFNMAELVGFDHDKFRYKPPSYLIFAYSM